MVTVFNTAAGRRRMALLWQVIDVLSANGLPVRLLQTGRPGDAERLARQAVRHGAAMVVAAGGDGTIAEVANGLIGSEVPLGVIPLGTANVLAHELALPFAPRAVAAALVAGRGARRCGVAAVRADAGRRVRRACGACAVAAAEAGAGSGRLCGAVAARGAALRLRPDPRAAGRAGNPGGECDRQQGPAVWRPLPAGAGCSAGRTRVLRRA